MPGENSRNDMDTISAELRLFVKEAIEESADKIFERIEPLFREVRTTNNSLSARVVQLENELLVLKTRRNFIIGMTTVLAMIFGATVTFLSHLLHW